MTLRDDLGRTIPYVTSIVVKDPFGKDQIYYAMGFLTLLPLGSLNRQTEPGLNSILEFPRQPST